MVFVNSTGDDIAAIYVRPHVSDDTDDSDDTWGSDLVNGKFTLKDKDKALYYYNKDQKDSDGKTVTSYDIRVTYTDEEKNECFFRDIPLPTVSQITLCMDTSGDDSIPYAKYLLGSTKKEVSTLSDVKKRLGLTVTAVILLMTAARTVRHMGHRRRFRMTAVMIRMKNRMIRTEATTMRIRPRQRHLRIRIRQVILQILMI